MSLRTNTNRFVNLMGIGATLAVTSSGMLMLLGPRGESEDETQGFLGLSGESFLEVHESAAAAFVAIVLLHLILHWRAILGVCKQCVRRRMRLINEPVVLLAIVITVMLTAATMPDEMGDGRGDDCVSSGSVIGNIAAYSHFGAGAAAALALTFHVSKRWRRLT